jgi:alcohol dehydrogenase, propanol-preferring
MLAMPLSEPAPITSNPLRWVQLPDPVPTAGEVRLAVKACAVCRTDLHVIEGELPRQKLPIIPGHQVVGVVDQLGTGCQRFKLGDRVGVAWLRSTCGVCRFCRAGKENLCEQARFTGYHADGGYATHCVVPEDFAYEIPAQFGDVEAAPLLCGGIIGYRAFARANVPAGGTLGLYGFGSSAHVVIQLAKARGCRVFAVSRGQRHQQLAAEMGADWVGSEAGDLPVKLDSAILFAPVGELVPPALEHLEKGGTLAVAGIHLSDVPPLNYERHLFYERDLRSVTANTRADGRGLLEAAAAIPIRPHPTVYPLAEANRALNDLKADRIAGTGVLVPEEGAAH